MTSSATPSRPALALRIGITGTRNLKPDQVSRLSAQIHSVLHAARQRTEELATRHTGVDAAYLHPKGTPPQPTLRFISPLARGADRLAAQQAVALGYRLHVPMPFPKADYEKDFDTPADLAEFHAMLARADEDWLALDGDRAQDMNRGYEAVGRYVVRHSDILIAVWDGSASRGRGGTADIVRYAAHSGIPVCWLHATQDCPAVWITDIQDLHHPVPAEMPAETALAAYLDLIIPPPAPCARHRHGIVGQMARIWQSPEFSPEQEYFSNRARPQRRCWRAYATLIRWTSGCKLPWSPPHRPDDATARHWFDRYVDADARAANYAARYRSSYVWIILFGTLALFFGASALVLSLLTLGEELRHVVTSACAGAEFLALLAIVFVVWLGTRRDWHERSIEYRLFAELCRKQQALAPLGWSLPITAVRGVATTDRPRADRAAWVAWLFAAESRSAPLPRGDLAHAAQGAPRGQVLTELITEQREYHEARSVMAERAGHTLERYGEVLFLLVVFCVLLKLGLTGFPHAHGWAVIFGFLATILPGVSAAFVAIRGYAELQLLAEQSRHMAAELKRAQRRVERLDTTQPLVSQDLGGEAAAVATLMLQDLDGWARLFRVKGMEAA